MRKTLSAAVLLLVLCGPTFAGEIPCPLNPEPGSRAVEGQAADGIIQNGEPDSLTEAVLGVIESVLALF
jgi:hypothetical protein